MKRLLLITVIASALGAFSSSTDAMDKKKYELLAKLEDGKLLSALRSVSAVQKQGVWFEGKRCKLKDAPLKSGYRLVFAGEKDGSPMLQYSKRLSDARIKKSDEYSMQSIAQQLGLLIKKEVRQDALTALVNGKLQDFDPLLGDTSCQIRVPLVIALYEKLGANKNVDLLDKNEQEFLLLAYVLTKAKNTLVNSQGKVEQDETICLYPLCKLLASNGAVDESLLQKCCENKENKWTTATEKIVQAVVKDDEQRRCIGALIDNAAKFKQKAPQVVAFHALQFLEKSLSGTQLPVVKLDSGVQTTPCLLSVAALFELVKSKKIPLLLRACRMDFSLPFITDINDPARIASNTLMRLEGCAKDDDPICVVDGVVGDSDAFCKADLKILYESIMLSSAVHYQLGKPYKDTALEDLLQGELVEQKSNGKSGGGERGKAFTCEEKTKELLNMYAALCKKCSNGKEKNAFLVNNQQPPFAVQHIFALTYKNRYANTVIPQYRKLN